MTNLFGFSSLLLKSDTLGLGGSLSFFTLLFETGGLFLSFNALTFGFGLFGGDSLRFDTSCLKFGLLLFFLFAKAFGLEASLFSLPFLLFFLDSQPFSFRFGGCYCLSVGVLLSKLGSQLLCLDTLALSLSFLSSNASRLLFGGDSSLLGLCLFSFLALLL